MPIDRDRLFLLHIVDAARQAMAYADGHERADLDDNPLLVDGFVRQLTIIGEAARRLSERTQRAHPDLPWTDIRGMRNFLVHEYFRVDLDAVWRTVVEDLPGLVRQLGQPGAGEE